MSESTCDRCAESVEACRCIDPTDPGSGPYELYAAAKLTPEAEQTYFVGARFEDGRGEWWNNCMTKSQATALCAALNWWYAGDQQREEDRRDTHNERARDVVRQFVVDSRPMFTPDGPLWDTILRAADGWELEPLRKPPPPSAWVRECLICNRTHDVGNACVDVVGSPEQGAV